MLISQFLKKDNVIFDLKSKTKDKALEEMVDRMKLSKEKKDLILLSLKQREILGTTGIGNGIAIPHARSVVLDKLCLYVGISQKGIEYESLDGKNVNIIFLIIAPPLDSSNQYLILLGKIAALSKKLIKKKDYLKIDNYEDFIELIKKMEESMEDEI
ncbi:MAG: PTS sugar transporter subunit IIA [candidate division WOR-3 bacterium]